jgi:rhodanese-related sulfurtransferase
MSPEPALVRENTEPALVRENTEPAVRRENTESAVPEQPRIGPYGVEHLLVHAREELDRVTPHEAADLQQRGALVIDIRPQSNRLTEGEIPGSLTVERIVLEWRLDPSGAHRLDGLRPDQPVVLVCNEGYASSLAAAQAQALGLSRATDLEGGFRAWKAAGLPVIPGGSAPAA